MILVDTSVWIDHLRRGNAHLAALLSESLVLCHPFIIGEIACGSLRQRRVVLSLLSELPQAVVAQHDEVLHLIESRRLSSRGIGWIDAHLAASAVLSGCDLWTLDKRLASVMKTLGHRHTR